MTTEKTIGFAFEKGYSVAPEILAVLQHCLLSNTPYVYSSPKNVPAYYCPVGGVSFVASVLTSFGISVPDPIGYPEMLFPFLGRRVEKITLENAFYRLTEWPLFVKPANTIKGLTGKVFNSTAELKQEDAIQFGVNMGDSSPVKITHVWISQPVSFRQEWRIYCHNGDISGLARYDDGTDEDKPPDTDFIKKLLKAYGDFAPAGFSLDVGEVDGQYLLVEINDGWALGFYRGMDPSAYAKLLASRFEELLKSRTTQV